MTDWRSKHRLRYCRAARAYPHRHECMRSWNSCRQPAHSSYGEPPTRSWALPLRSLRRVWSPPRPEITVLPSLPRPGFEVCDAEVFLSSQVPEAKRKKIESYGARIRTVGQNPLDAEIAARAAAAESGRTYVSPYNDWQVIAGQGTIGVELVSQIDAIDAIFIATGGGGLISGVGGYLRKRSPHTEIVGCWPENSRVLYECIQAGKIIEFPESLTLSESTAGGVEPGSITFELARAAMHRGVLVSEEAILDAMKWAREQNWTIEGAAGVALAAIFQEAARYEGKSGCIVLRGDLVT